MRWIVIWKAAGEWRCTSMMFVNERDAQAHARNLSDKDADHRDNPTYTNIIVTPIRIPE